MRSVLVLLLFASCSFAADVKIEGKDKIPVGQYAELTVKAASGDQVGWQIAPVPVQSTIKNDLACFALTPGQTYTVFVTIVNFDTKRFDQGTKTVSYDGIVPVPPNPTPIPPNPVPIPDGSLGMVRVSKGGADKVVSATKPIDQLKLANAARSTASAIAAGGVTPATPSGYLAAWRIANNAAGLQDKNAWIPWSNDVGEYIKTLNEGGKLTGKQLWTDMFNEIAVGLGG